MKIRNIQIAFFTVNNLANTLTIPKEEILKKYPETKFFLRIKTTGKHKNGSGDMILPIKTKQDRKMLYYSMAINLQNILTNHEFKLIDIKDFI